MNLKMPSAIFLLIAFSNIKKAYLRISKHPFHTNPNNDNFKGKNLHKNHYTNR